MTQSLHFPAHKHWLALTLLAMMAPPSLALDIPDTPLFLNATGVKPNFILTLDDSGSMAWGFALSEELSDSGCNNSGGTTAGCANTRFYKSAYSNALYYNPSLQYYPPPKYNGNSDQCTLDPSTNPSTCYDNVSFSAAPLNGFDLTRGSTTGIGAVTCNPTGTTVNASPVNLSSNYAATRTYAPDSNTQTCATAEGVTTPTGTLTYSAACNVNFDNNGTNDRIRINSGCAGVFSNGTPATIRVIGSSRAGTYTVSSMANPYFYVTGNPWSNAAGDLNDRNVTIEYEYTGTSTTYPAYYYLFFNQLGIARPANCTATVADQKGDQDCYVKVNVGSTGSGAAGTGWEYTDIYKNPDGTPASVAQKQQNFANWYSYYRTRNLALVSNVMAALTGLDDDVRAAWQALNTCTTWTLSGTSCEGWNTAAPGYDNRMQALNGTTTTGNDSLLGTATTSHRQELYAWLSRLPANSGTPLRSAARRAGRYVDESVTALSATSPYAENPPNAAGTYHACRRNIHLLMTDGIWNSDTITAFGNANSSTTDLPGDYTLPDDATSWTPGRPYSDGNSDSLADIAFYYWAKDLSSTLDNNLTSLVIDRSGTLMEQWKNPKNDPAEWQHMTTYAIGLGLSSTLTQTGFPQWGGSTWTGDYDDLVSGSQSWPTTGSDFSPGNAYDLWHAAISGRGKFYSAEDAQSLKAAFKDVVDTVSAIAESGGGAGLSSSSTEITNDTTLFSATFNGDWSGAFHAYPIQGDGSLAAPYWEAGVLIPFAADRKIFTMNGGTAEEFAACTGDLADALDYSPSYSPPAIEPNLCSQRLAWLRGHHAVTNATWTATVATYTAPKHGLKNGDAVVISGVTPVGYNGTFSITYLNPDTFSVTIASDPGAFSTATQGTVRYAAFRNREGTVLGDIMHSAPVYVHKEDFGYGAPSITTLGGHDTYTDYLDYKASRKPMVFVGANDGMLHGFNAETSGVNAGKEVMAYVPAGVYDKLNQLPETTYSHRYYVDGSPIMGDAYLNDGNSDTSGWNTVVLGSLGAGGKSIFALDVTKPDTFSENDVLWEFTDTDLGLTFSQPQIAADLPNRWVAIFGNGYNSDDGKAYLYVRNLADGSEIAKIATNSETDNGLSTPFAFDSNGDKIVDVVYAGDLRGNLWKFVNTSGAWTLGNGGQPLFTASYGGNRQPITAQPTAAILDTAQTMVYFGTGSYIATDDLTDEHRQSFYALWDNEWGSTITRSELQQQTFSQSGGFRQIDAIATPVVDPKGWFVDFPTTAGTPSERIVTNPLVKNFSTLEDRVLFVTTIPTTDPCDRGGSSWLMELRAETGGAFSAPVLDTDGDGDIDSDDTIVAGAKLDQDLGIVTSLTWVSGDGIAMKYFPGSKGTVGSMKNTDDPNPLPGALTPTRVYWQQIM